MKHPEFFRCFKIFDQKPKLKGLRFFGKTGTTNSGFDTWFARYESRLQREGTPPNDRASAMDLTNPIYIPRNHLGEEALSDAINGNLDLFDKMLEIVSHPFDERRDAAKFAEPAPANFGPYKTFCGT